VSFVITEFGRSCCVACTRVHARIAMQQTVFHCSNVRGVILRQPSRVLQVIHQEQWTRPVSQSRKSEG